VDDKLDSELAEDAELVLELDWLDSLDCEDVDELD